MNSKFPSFFMFLLLTVLCGVILNIPYHNFQNFLSQGDHGRDLYAFGAVVQGDVPYKDFWWVYGPLMPYYYGLFFKVFGVQITSVLLGKIVLNILAGVFFFLAFARLFPLLPAFTAAVWFMTFHEDFFFTYNHAGGITLIMAAIWMHCAYLKTARLHYGWAVLAVVFILGLVKINFALTTLAMTIAVFAAKDYLDRAPFTISKKIFYVSAALFVPLAWFATYAGLLHGLTTAEIRQCLPYLGGDEPYNHLSPLQTIPLLAKVMFMTIKSNAINIGLALLFILAAGQTLYLLLSKKIDPARRNVLWLLLGYAICFYILNLHEFLKSGILYRSFWSQPFSVFLTFICLATASEQLTRLVRGLLWGGLILIAGWLSWNNAQRVNAYKTPAHFLAEPRANVYSTNDPSWIQTVATTTHQLHTVLKKDELFVALPYDCLYYYLTGKKTPTRQLIFFDHIKIPLEQEQKIIQELESKHIAAAVVSSRQSAIEPGLGTLGVTYCELMSKYLNSNFVPIAKMGNWTDEPGWNWNHGTLILKRKLKSGPHS